MFKNKDYELYLDDCLKVMDELIEQEIKVDMILIDPPYEKTRGKWDVIIPINPMWERINKLIKKEGAICIFGNEPFSSMVRMSNINNYKYDWKWNKTVGGNPLIAKYRPIGIFEDNFITIGL